MKINLILILSAVFMLAACAPNEPAAESPAGVLRQYVEASQKKDTAAMKRLLSRGSLALLEKSAKDQNLTVDEILRKESAAQIQNAPETRNEKIEGDRATLEVKNEKTGLFDMTLPFVREDGAWKIARDRYIEQLIDRANEEKRRAANLSNGSAAPNASNTNAANQ